jgi:hypothetical protein
MNKNFEPSTGHWGSTLLVQTMIIGPHTNSHFIVIKVFTLANGDRTGHIPN